MSYKKLKNEFGNEDKTTILNKTTNEYVPLGDIDNRHYQEYKAWLDAGNTPEAAD